MTLRDTVAGANAIVVSAMVAACGGSATAPQAGHSAGVCGGQTGVSTATSMNYVVVLVATTQVGPGAAIPSASQSPTSLPAVLSGTEAAISGPGATHLELHICNRTTGAVVSGLHPDVTLRNASIGAAPMGLPVAVLQDAGQGVNGIAYGNNVRLEEEQTYTLGVRIDSADSVTLSYTVPLTGPTLSPGCGHPEMC